MSICVCVFMLCVFVCMFMHLPSQFEHVSKARNQERLCGFRSLYWNRVFLVMRVSEEGRRGWGMYAHLSVCVYWFCNTNQFNTYRQDGAAVRCWQWLWRLCLKHFSVFKKMTLMSNKCQNIKFSWGEKTIEKEKKMMMKLGKLEQKHRWLSITVAS